MFSSFMDFRIHRSVLRRHIKGGHFNRTWGCSSSLTLSNLLLQIFKSKSFQQYISANMAAVSSSCTLFFGSGAHPAARPWKRSVRSFHLKCPYQTLKRPFSRWNEKQTWCAWLCLHVSVGQKVQVTVFTPRWWLPFPLRSIGFLPGIVVSTVQIWILLTPLSRAGVSNAASCVRWNSQPSLSSCWDGATPKPKLITLNEQKL